VADIGNFEFLPYKVSYLLVFEPNAEIWVKVLKIFNFYVENSFYKSLDIVLGNMVN